MNGRGREGVKAEQKSPQRRRRLAPHLGNLNIHVERRPKSLALATQGKYEAKLSENDFRETRCETLDRNDGPSSLIVSLATLSEAREIALKIAPLSRSEQSFWMTQTRRERERSRSHTLRRHGRGRARKDADVDTGAIPKMRMRWRVRRREGHKLMGCFGSLIGKTRAN